MIFVICCTRAYAIVGVAGTSAYDMWDLLAQLPMICLASLAQVPMIFLASLAQVPMICLASLAQVPMIFLASLAQVPMIFGICWHNCLRCVGSAGTTAYMWRLEAPGGARGYEMRGLDARSALRIEGGGNAIKSIAGKNSS